MSTFLLIGLAIYVVLFALVLAFMAPCRKQEQRFRDDVEERREEREAA